MTLAGILPKLKKHSLLIRGWHYNIMIKIPKPSQTYFAPLYIVRLLSNILLKVARDCGNLRTPLSYFAQQSERSSPFFCWQVWSTGRLEMSKNQLKISTGFDFHVRFLGQWNRLGKVLFISSPWHRTTMTVSKPTWFLFSGSCTQQVLLLFADSSTKSFRSAKIP